MLYIFRGIREYSFHFHQNLHHMPTRFGFAAAGLCSSVEGFIRPKSPFLSNPLSSFGRNRLLERLRFPFSRDGSGRRFHSPPAVLRYAILLEQDRIGRFPNCSMPQKPFSSSPAGQSPDRIIRRFEPIENDRLGGISVIRIRKKSVQLSRRPLGITAFRLLVAAGLAAYLRCACRIRIFGRIPGHQPGMLIISNHLHDIEGMLIPSRLVLRNPFRHSLRFAASQRLFEPGFLAAHYPRLPRWLSRVNLGKLFYAFGARPVENQPLSRPFVSYAYDAFRRHGNLPAEVVFSAETLQRLRMPSETTLRDFWSPRFLMAAQQPASIVDLREPYRTEFRFRIRNEIRNQLDTLERELREGATVYLTPEGRLSETGFLCRLRLALARLETPARSRMLIGLSYDPYARRRLSVYVRFAPWSPHADVHLQLRAVRPITVSQVLCDRLLEARPERFSAEQALDAVRERLGQLPPGAFVVPELLRHTERMVRLALGNMARLGVLTGDGREYRIGSVRTHRAFPNVPDMLAHLRNTFRDTTAALEALAKRTAAEPSTAASQKAVAADLDLTPN